MYDEEILFEMGFTIKKFRSKKIYMLKKLCSKWVLRWRNSDRSRGICWRNYVPNGFYDEEMQIEEGVYEGEILLEEGLYDEQIMLKDCSNSYIMEAWFLGKIQACNWSRASQEVLLLPLSSWLFLRVQCACPLMLQIFSPDTSYILMDYQLWKRDC